MKREEILKIFIESGAFLEGHFRLSSGKHSPKYLQCAGVLQYPNYTEILCRELADKFREDAIDTVIAPALGGILVSYEVARSLNIRSIFTERVDGKMTLRRGFDLSKNNNVLVVEDVITTGLSTREVCEVVKSFGANIVGVGSLVDRSKGEINFGVRFESLLKIDVATYSEEECPLCKNKIPVIKPGSRPAIHP